MTADIETFAQVKPVCAKALYAGVQMQLRASELACMILQPFDHQGTGTL